MKRFFYLMLIIALPLIAEWQYPSSVNIMKPQEGWVQWYSWSKSSDYGKCGYPTSDGGYIFAGNSVQQRKIRLLKTDQNGETLWTRSFDGSQIQHFQPTDDGGYIITGYTITGSFGEHLLLMKVNSNGDFLWEKEYFEFEHGYFPAGYFVIQTDDGGYVVTGNNTKTLFKTDGNGDSLWLRELSNKSTCVQQTSDGGFIIGGFVYSPTGYVWLIKTDSLGQVIWERRPFEASEWTDCYYIQETSDGGYIGTGSTIIGDELDLLLFKTDSNGNVIWTKTYGSDDRDRGYCIQQTQDKGFIISGGTYNINGGGLWLLKTDSLGDTLWTRVFGIGEGAGVYQLGGERCSYVTLTEDGGYLVTSVGTFLGSGEGWWNMFFIKTDSMGKGIPIEICAARIISPQDVGYVTPITPKAQFTNIGSEDYTGDFYCHCEMVDPVYHANFYHDSVLVTGGLGSWEVIEIEFREWADIDTAYYTTSFYATSASGDTLRSRPVSMTFFWGCIEEEQPPITHPGWQLLSSIGSQVVMKYQDYPVGFHVQVFNAAGQKVDEVHSAQTGGTVEWGDGFSPGVYFIVPETQGAVRAQKVVLIR